ncbi:MAG: HNH endonuclease, partial [Acidimicrobiia bacterium]|nr:HNH endonuclease [Acidimicrobiia bacterium]
RERYWEADGAHSNGEWLAWFLDVNTSTGRDWTRTARRLQDLPALADALVDLAVAHITADTDCDRATIVVQVPVTALTTQDESAGPGGWILAGPPISAETAYGRDRYESRPPLFACDSRYQTVLYSEDGTARCVGSLRRSVPPHLSRIIRLRDVTCRWPGCERTSRLHVHHIVHWARGGPTTTANCTALCPRHHRHVHETGHQIEGDADHTLTFKRPDGKIIDIRPPPPP